MKTELRSFFPPQTCRKCGRPQELSICITCLVDKTYQPSFGDLVDRALASPWAGRALRLLTKLRPRFEPQATERHVACASCPFREGNESQWAKIVRMLRSAGYATTTPYLCADPVKFRRRVKVIGLAGNFYCHTTAYRADGSMAPPREFLQCPGATRWARTGTTIPRGAER